MDKGAFFRLALSYLGESEVKDGTPVMEALEDVAQHVIALALDYAQWPFALMRAVLPLDEEGACALPADCLELRACSLPRFEVVGRTLFNLGPKTPRVTLTYKCSALADSVCLPESEPAFCEGCAYLLAAKAAPRLTSNFRLAADLEARGYAMLYRAKLKATRSLASNDQEPRGIGRRAWHG